jgi:hypothetical protein
VIALDADERGQWCRKPIANHAVEIVVRLPARLATPALGDVDAIEAR